MPVIPAKAGIQPIDIAFQPPFFSTTFPLLAANYLCFHTHSGLAPDFSATVLCFHRHSRFVRLILKNSFLLPLQGATSRPVRGEPVGRLFVRLGTFSEAGWGGQQHCRMVFPAGRDLLPSINAQF
jgi:hypothetical protein